MSLGKRKSGSENSQCTTPQRRRKRATAYPRNRTHLASRAALLPASVIHHSRHTHTRRSTSCFAAPPILPTSTRRPRANAQSLARRRRCYYTSQRELGKGTTERIGCGDHLIDKGRRAAEAKRARRFGVSHKVIVEADVLPCHSLSQHSPPRLPPRSKRSGGARQGAPHRHTAKKAIGGGGGGGGRGGGRPPPSAVVGQRRHQSTTWRRSNKRGAQTKERRNEQAGRGWGW